MGITEFLAQYITAFIQTTGYPGVFVLMVMESMVFPVPSEAVMPFAGFLIFEKNFTFHGIIFFSTLGSIVGSLISYFLGAKGGKYFVDRFGKYLLLDAKELKYTEKIFHQYGEITIFLSRFIPVVRHLISIPAGIGGMNICRFSIYTIIGAGLWNSFLTVAGFYLKKNWVLVMQYSRIFDVIILIILSGMVILFIAHRVRKIGCTRSKGV